jgi:hypothetical protein
MKATNFFSLLLRPALLALFLVATTAVTASAKEPLPTVEQALKDKAPALLEYLRTNKCQTVGVLKFLVKKDGKPLSANVGALNTTLANRLEIALILENDPKAPINIIQNASAVAATLKGANHTTAKGREVLFKYDKYPLSWGTGSDKANMFFTGEAEISRDCKTVAVRVLAYTPDTDKGDEVVKFTALASSKVLSEAGKTFYLRRMTHRPEGSEPDPEEAAQESQNGLKQNPLNDTDRPVSLEVYYDDQLVFDGSNAHQFRSNDEGEILIPTPSANQKVRFRIKRTPKAQAEDIYGAVLLVNGVNTWFEQRERAPQEYAKSILTGKDSYADVTGFYVMKPEGKKIIPFKTLSDEESKDRENLYVAAQNGTIFFAVYRDLGASGGPPSVNEPLLRGIGKGTLQPVNSSGKKFGSLGELKKSLLSSSKGSVRGMIAHGDDILNADWDEVQFNTDPNPIVAVTLRYYRPQN